MAGRLLQEGDVERKGAMVVALIWAAVACGVVWGAEAAVEPSAGPSGQDDRCSRPLIDVLQGFVVTLLAIAVSSWGAFKHTENSLSMRLLNPLLFTCSPLTELGGYLDGSCECVALLWRCHNFPNVGNPLRRNDSPWKRVFVSLLPWEKSRVRILAACDVVLYIPPNSPLLQNRRLDNMRRDDAGVQDESEAMIIGDPGVGYTRIEVGGGGICAMELAGVLPPYDKLKFLRGNSSFAMLVIAIQAIGYIYAVVYRTITDLKVAPVEVIGLVLNIVLLVKASLLSICNPCHRPLVIYMNQDKDIMLNTFLSEESAEPIVKEHEHSAYWASGLLGSVFVFVGVILGYYIVRMVGDVEEVIIIPLKMFLIGCCSAVVHVHIFYIKSTLASLDIVLAFGTIILVVLNAIIYIWVYVVTIVYWNLEQFSVRAKLLSMSQLIPHIG